MSGRIFLLDADMGGTDSITSRINDESVVHLPCTTFMDFEQHAKALLGIVTPDDRVVLDTLSKLLDTTRGDMKLGTDVSADLWERRSIYFSDKNYLTVYEAAGQLVMRRLKNLRARGARIVVTAHESETLDQSSVPPIKRRGPDVNPAMVGNLLASSSDVFRLWSVPEDMLNTDGTVGVKAETRVLYLRRGAEHLAKFHVERAVADTIPRFILDPTYDAICAVLGKVPTWLTIYGPSGAGKTTLATSPQLDTHTTTTTTTTQKEEQPA